MSESIKRDYIVTFLVTIGVMGATVLLYKLAQSQFGTQGFSEFSFVKRIIAFLAPLMAMGMGVGVPREVAIVNGTETDERKYEILRNSLLITIVLFAVLFIQINILSGLLAGLLFGDSKFHYLLNPMAICLLGAMLNSLVYSYYRGLNRFMIASLIQIVNIIIIPVVVILLSSDIPTFLVVYGALSSLMSLVFITKHFFHGTSSFINIHLLFHVTRYSIKRLPGDIALQLMFVIPPILTAHTLSFNAAGDISFSLTILTLITVPLSPISVLLLPKAVMWMKEGKISFLMKSTGGLLLKVAICMAIVSIVLFFSAEGAVRFFLPEREAFDFFILKIITLVALPYSVYIYLRSFIDAFHETSYNSINCLISLIVFLSASGFLGYVVSARIGIAAGLVCGFYALGILTYYRIHRDRAILNQAKS